jgi:hypothetical protein
MLVMQQEHPLDYGRTIVRRYPARLISVVVFVASASLAWGSDYLEHMPYRPPVDMSTALGSGELETARALKWCCVAVSGASVGCFGAITLRRLVAA